MMASRDQLPVCIYCPQAADSPEHWLPRSLGTFGDLQVLHGRLCTACNEALGREVDYEFVRTGPEGMFRAGLGVEGRRGSASGNPFYYRAAMKRTLIARASSSQRFFRGSAPRPSRVQALVKHSVN